MKTSIMPSLMRELEGSVRFHKASLADFESGVLPEDFNDHREEYGICKVSLVTSSRCWCVDCSVNKFSAKGGLTLLK